MSLAQSTSWGHFPNWNLEFRIVGFWGEGKTGVPGEKPLRAKTRTNNKLNLHMMPSPGIKPGPHWWEASALTTAPSLLPKMNWMALKYLNDSFSYPFLDFSSWNPFPPPLYICNSNDLWWEMINMININFSLYLCHLTHKINVLCSIIQRQQSLQCKES